MDSENIVKALLEIRNALNDPITRNVTIISTFISLISVCVAAFGTYFAAKSASYSKDAATELVISRRNELRPILEIYSFTEDSSKNENIISFKCLGKGSLFNLLGVFPDQLKKLNMRDLELGNVSYDHRVSKLPDGEFRIEYEDLFGNRYQSIGKLVNNNLESRLRQEYLG